MGEVDKGVGGGKERKGMDRSFIRFKMLKMLKMLSNMCMYAALHLFLAFHSCKHVVMPCASLQTYLKTDHLCSGSKISLTVLAVSAAGPGFAERWAPP